MPCKRATDSNVSLGACCGMCDISCNVVSEYFLSSSVNRSELRCATVVELILIDVSVGKELSYL